MPAKRSALYRTARLSSISSTSGVQRARSRLTYPSLTRYGLLACSGLLVLLVLALRWLLWHHRAFPGDAWAAHLGESHKSWLVYKITRGYQQIGRPIIAIGEVLVMLTWLWFSGGWRTARGLLIALLASASCGLIKVICGPTPMWLDLHHVGANFPSGVVTFVTAALGYVAVVGWRQGRRLMPAVLIVVIAGAGPARVLGGQHLISDVLGGYMLGTAWLGAALVYLGATARRRGETRT
jgi:membrane-associated phospholipid phosphatase